MTGESYGGLKVLCEKIVEERVRQSRHHHPAYLHRRARRPHRPVHLLAVARIKGGEMLAPGTPNDPFQYIDVRDLADFIRICVEKNVTGKYNLCGPQGAVTMGSLLDECKNVTGAKTTFVWASPEFLTAQEVIGEKAKGNLMPIWQPPVGEEGGLLLVSPARARKKGLKFRSLETTIRDTLAWQKTRPEDKQVLKAGLTMERGNELLKKLREA